MSSLSAAIREAYTVAPSNVVIIHTLEVAHAGFGEDGPLRLVQGYETVAVGIPGETGTAEFTPCPFEFITSQLDDSASPEASVSIDNTAGVLTELFDKVTSTQPVEVTYRPYLSTDLTQPASQSQVFSLTNISINVRQITGRLKIADLGNDSFPRRIYTLDHFGWLSST